MTKGIELHVGIEEYIAHLVATGQKPSTVGTAKRSLALFEAHLGAGKVLAKILPVHVAGFFKSDAATTRNDKPRAQASVLQIRRIVRAALVWWHEQGYASTIPVPKAEQRFLESRTGRQDQASEPTESPRAE